MFHAPSIFDGGDLMRSLRLFLRATFVASLLASMATRSAIAQSDVTAPTNAVVGVKAVAGADSVVGAVGTTAGANNWPEGEPPTSAFDNFWEGPVSPAPNTATKYLNFGETDTGVIVTPSLASIVTGLQLYTANDSANRDPLTYTLEGTNALNPSIAGTPWSLISSGDTGLQTDPDRFMPGVPVNFANSTAYTSYRLLFPTVRDASANSMQIGEIELLGRLVPVPEPSTISLIVGGALSCGLVRRRKRG